MITDTKTPRDRSETPETLTAKVEHGAAVPSVGRIVHVRTAGGECMAAIVVQVLSDIEVNLTVFDMDGNTYPYPGAMWQIDWHWPERNAG